MVHQKVASMSWAHLLKPDTLACHVMQSSLSDCWMLGFSLKKEACTPSGGVPVFRAATHQGLSLLVKGVLRGLGAPMECKGVLVTRGTAFCMQMCNQQPGGPLSNGTLGRGPGPLRGGLGRGAPLIGGVIVGLEGLVAAAL